MPFLKCRQKTVHGDELESNGVGLRIVGRQCLKMEEELL